VAQQMVPRLDLDEIQGDLLIGMHKNAQLFIFFKVVDVARFKARTKEYLIGRVTSARTAQDRERRIYERRRRQDAWLGLNLGFTKDGLRSYWVPAGCASIRISSAGLIIRRRSPLSTTRLRRNGCVTSCRTA